MAVGRGAAGISVPPSGALDQPDESHRGADHSLTPAAPCLCPQRSARSWWSSSNAWSSNPSPGCSCFRTSRSSSAGKLRLSSSTPAAWRSWPSGSPPRSAVPGSTSSSEERAGAGPASRGGPKARRRQRLPGGRWCAFKALGMPVTDPSVRDFLRLPAWRVRVEVVLMHKDAAGSE